MLPHWYAHNGQQYTFHIYIYIYIYNCIPVKSYFIPNPEIWRRQRHTNAEFYELWHLYCNVTVDNPILCDYSHNDSRNTLGNHIISGAFADSTKISTLKPLSNRSMRLMATEYHFSGRNWLFYQFVVYPPEAIFRSILSSSKYVFLVAASDEYGRISIRCRIVAIPCSDVTHTDKVNRGRAYVKDK